MPQMLAQFPPMIATMQSMRTMMLTMHSTMSGIFDQMDELSDNATAMGQGISTPPRTTTLSTCRRRSSRTRTSNA